MRLSVAFLFPIPGMMRVLQRLKTSRSGNARCERGVKWDDREDRVSCRGFDAYSVSSITSDQGTDDSDKPLCLCHGYAYFNVSGHRSPRSSSKPSSNPT